MNMITRNKKILLNKFIPNVVLNSKNNGKNYELNLIEDGAYLTLNYLVESHNHLGSVGQRCFTCLLPKYIKKNQETFEVLGLLQAEMGKQQDGKIVFCNHEYQLVNKVIKWFEKEFNFSKEKWKWYIKVNINEPVDKDYKNKIENKVINYWIEKTKFSLEHSYPKKVNYIKNTKNTKLGFCDYGTLIIEKRDNLFSQVIKKLVREITKNILNYSDSEIRGFLRGIIAGESCIELHIPTKKFRVHISANNIDEKVLYHQCFKKLGIASIMYKYDKLVVSKKENHLKLLKQKLMTLSHKKYNKFLRMVKLYENYKDLEEWQNKLQKPWNKIPQWKINKIVELHNKNPNWSAWKIAEQVGVSDIKVQRVRKEMKNYPKDTLT